MASWSSSLRNVHVKHNGPNRSQHSDFSVCCFVKPTFDDKFSMETVVSSEQLVIVYDTINLCTNVMKHML